MSFLSNSTGVFKSAAFKGQYLKYKNTKMDVELEVPSAEFCVDQKIVNKAVVEELWQAGLSPM
jgi:hypothetical protein